MKGKMVLTGIVLIGLGVVAWTYLGSDIRRHIRICTM